MRLFTHSHIIKNGTTDTCRTYLIAPAFGIIRKGKSIAISVAALIPANGQRLHQHASFSEHPKNVTGRAIASPHSLII